MIDNKTMGSSRLPGEHFPDDFARQVIAQARRERSQRHNRVATAAGLVLLLGLIPVSHVLRQSPGTSIQAQTSWSDYAAQANQVADATAPVELSDYLAPDAARVGNWSGAYAEVSSQYDSDGEND